MMDIAEKLRTYKRDRSGYAEYCHRAADEIERLRDEIAALKQTLAMSVTRHLYDEICAEADALRKVFDAAENLVKVRGRYHAEMAYERLASAIDAAMKKSATSNP